MEEKNELIDIDNQLGILEYIILKSQKNGIY